MLVAGFAAAGVMLLACGAWRAGRRSVTTRRIAAILSVDEPLPGRGSHAPILAPPPRWRLELGQLIATIQTRDATLRGPAIALACVSGLIGISTLGTGWLVLAALSGATAYWLGGRARRRQRIETQALNAMHLLASGLRAG